MKGEKVFVENGKNLSVSMESGDPEFAAKLINDYVSFFDLETIRALVSAVQDTIEQKITDIEYKIASKRQMAKLRREDQINEIVYSISSKRELAKQRRDDEIANIENNILAKREGAKKRRDDQVLRFKEAIVIADSLGIRKREDARSFIKSSQMNLDIITSSNPLYYAGTQTLEAEIKILQNRKSDDPFIPELRDLQEQLALLRSFKFNVEGMHAVTVDQAAYAPKNRIKPNRKLIVSLGTVAGFFLGIFLVFFVSFLQKQKETHFE